MGLDGTVAKGLGAGRLSIQGTWKAAGSSSAEARGGSALIKAGGLD